MAVTLPTITINDNAVAQTVLDAFSDGIDPATGQPLTPQQAYRRWLKSQLIEFVARKRADEMATARLQADTEALAAERQALIDATAS